MIGLGPSLFSSGSGSGGAGYDDAELRGRVSETEVAIARLDDDVVVQPALRIGYYDEFSNYAGGDLLLDMSFDYVVEPTFEGDDGARSTSTAITVPIEPNASFSALVAAVQAAVAAVPGGDEISVYGGPTYLRMRTGITSSYLVVHSLEWTGVPYVFSLEQAPLYASRLTLDGVKGLAQDGFDIAVLANNLVYGKADQSALDAVSSRVTTLENAPSPSGGRYKRVLLGVHAILSGTTFNKSGLLAQAWMAGVSESECEADLYLVGGGGSGVGTYSQSGSGGSFVCGGSAGEVRIVRAIQLSDVADGTSLYVGAGGVAPAFGSNPGGATGFGPYIARGGTQILDGSSAGPGPTNVFPISLSDVPLGLPGRTGGAAFMNATPSQGPGAGGGASSDFSDVSGNGGDANALDISLRRLGGSGIGVAGSSAPAASLGYGSGGAGRSRGGASGQVGGAGGFPGGGGGGRFGYFNDGSERGGNGNSGVIRLAVYRWIAA